ncbi:MAG: hypothetical protein PHW17_09165 [Desulfobacterales bacterium]|nr:hypothetical protein [Desulfobacterales bacterium]
MAKYKKFEYIQTGNLFVLRPFHNIYEKIQPIFSHFFLFWRFFLPGWIGAGCQRHYHIPGRRDGQRIFKDGL